MVTHLNILPGKLTGGGDHRLRPVVSWDTILVTEQEHQRTTTSCVNYCCTAKTSEEKSLVVSDFLATHGL